MNWFREKIMPHLKKWGINYLMKNGEFNMPTTVLISTCFCRVNQIVLLFKSVHAY